MVPERRLSITPGQLCGARRAFLELAAFRAVDPRERKVEAVERIDDTRGHDEPGKPFLVAGRDHTARRR